MNEKITLQLLAERLPADIFGADADSRAALVSEIFALASEILSEGHELTVKGLGTFSPSADNPASPVIFTPDDHFTAIVNAPFAGFHTVEIADGVSDNMLDRVTVAPSDGSHETPREEVREEPEVAVGVIPGPEPVPESAIPGPEPLPESHIPSPEPLPAAELPEAAPLPPAYIPEPSPIPPAYIPEPEPRVQPQIAEEDRPSDFTPPVIVDETGISGQPEISDEEASVSVASVEIAPVPVDESVAGQEVIPAGGTVVDEAVQEEPAYDYDADPAYQQQEPQSSRFGSGFFWGFLTGLLIGAVVLLIYVMLTAGPAPDDPYEAAALDADAVETMME